METKELNFKGFKMNGFLGLFVHLIVLPALIFFWLYYVCANCNCVWYSLHCLADNVCRLYAIGTE